MENVIRSQEMEHLSEEKTPSRSHDDDHQDENDEDGSTGSSSLKRKQPRRRPKKKSSRRAWKKLNLLSEEDEENNALRPKRSKDDGASEVTPEDEEAKRRQVLLRPTNGPLVNAPKNSTQFIIDDHVAEVRRQDRDDESDDIYWENEFQSAYESARQEEVSHWDRRRLFDELRRLERKHVDLVRTLAELHPGVYLRKLQTELLSLREVNRVLRLEREELGPPTASLPDSSTKSPPQQQPQPQQHHHQQQQQQSGVVDDPNCD